jgi:hypothetical protein
MPVQQHCELICCLRYMLSTHRVTVAYLRGFLAATTAPPPPLTIGAVVPGSAFTVTAAVAVAAVAVAAVAVAAAAVASSDVAAESAFTGM